MDTLSQKIYDIGVVPVIKLDNPERDALPLAKALCDGGVPVAEVTFRAKGAEKAIKAMREGYPNMIVGAGTVLTIDQIHAAKDAGAQFIVSPGFNPKTVEECQKLNLPIFPGCTTPTEIEAALGMGLTTLKFFPAEQSGGLAKIKSMSAPFSMVKFMPTGGISLKNLADYIGNKSIIACGGSYMVSADLINNQKWGEITDLCLKSVDIVKQARG